MKRQRRHLQRIKSGNMLSEEDLFSTYLNNQEILSIFEELKQEKLADTENQPSALSVDLKDIRFVA